ncbi:unnamed protein product [Pleuronectes platessa]|uniref:Uncharacterized protein n=1 Tax=Pleuronectes platessa TaxID=8262 RepID=A0A9N7VXM8_PLEPL|nr:unnamed protein product [Pleuronectes platessa]
MGRKGLWFDSTEKQQKDEPGLICPENPRGFSLPCLVPLSKAPYPPNICSPGAVHGPDASVQEQAVYEHPHWKPTDKYASQQPWQPFNGSVYTELLWRRILKRPPFPRITAQRGVAERQDESSWAF